MTRMILPAAAIHGSEDDPWDVFIADDDERDPEPEPGDFWTDDESLALANSNDNRTPFICWEGWPCCR